MPSPPGSNHLIESAKKAPVSFSLSLTRTQGCTYRLGHIWIQRVFVPAGAYIGTKIISLALKSFSITAINRHQYILCCFSIACP